SISAEGLLIVQLLPNARLDRYCISNANIRVGLSNVMSLEHHALLNRQLSTHAPVSSSAPLPVSSGIVSCLPHQTSELDGEWGPSNLNINVGISGNGNRNSSTTWMSRRRTTSANTFAEASEQTRTQPHLRLASIFRSSFGGVGGSGGGSGIGTGTGTGIGTGTGVGEGGNQQVSSFGYGPNTEVVTPEYAKHLNTAFAADKSVIRNDLLTRQYVMKMHYHLPRLCRLWVDLLLFAWILFMGLLLMWQVHHFPRCYPLHLITKPIMPQMDMSLSSNSTAMQMRSQNIFILIIVCLFVCLFLKVHLIFGSILFGSILFGFACFETVSTEMALTRQRNETKSELTSVLFENSVLGRSFASKIEHVEYYWLICVAISLVFCHTLLFVCYYGCKACSMIFRFYWFRKFGVDPLLWLCCVCCCCCCCHTCKTPPSPLIFTANHNHKDHGNDNDNEQHVLLRVQNDQLSNSDSTLKKIWNQQPFLSSSSSLRKKASYAK
ncbi:PPE family protein, partial [Reticulomyxa filosa]